MRFVAASPSSTGDGAARPPGGASDLFEAFAFICSPLLSSLLLVGCSASPPQIDWPAEAVQDSHQQTTAARQSNTLANTPALDAAPTDGGMQRPAATFCTNEGAVVTTGIPVSCETLCVCRNMADDGNCHAAYSTRELCIRDCYAKKWTPSQLCCMAARCTAAHIGDRMSVPGFTFKGPPLVSLHHELCREVRGCQ